MSFPMRSASHVTAVILLAALDISIALAVDESVVPKKW